MQRSELNTRITMKPSEMGEEVKTFLLRKLKENKKCLNSFTNGYITKILKIVSYENILSVVTANIIFNVVYLAEVIKLKPGIKLLGIVKMTLSTGILCQFQDIKIWIPSGKTAGYKFSASVYTKGQNFIKIGDEIQATILEIRYEKKNFACIASLTT